MNIRSTSRLSRGIQRVQAARRMMYDPAPQQAPQIQLPMKTQDKSELSFSLILSHVMEGVA